MKQFLKNVSIILLLIFGGSMLLSLGSLWSLRNSSFYKPSFLVNDVKETTFDYIVLGASTGLITLNTNAIDSITHAKGLNLSIDDSALSTHYTMLHHFLAQGKTASYCILAPSNTSYDLKINKFSNNDYRFLPYVDRNYVYDHYDRYSVKEANILKYSKYLPMLGISYYNAELFYPSVLSAFKPKRRNRFDAKGNYSYPVKHFKSHSIEDRQSFDVDFSNPYLIKIKELCDQHNIKLICYFSPMKNRKATIVNNDYISINHSAFITDEKYFFDGIHVNSMGRELASVRFAEQFKNIMQDFKFKENID